MTMPAPTLEQMLGSFGAVETRKLSRVEAFTAKAMARNWTNVPHVTHSDLIDVEALEQARRRINAGRASPRLSPLPFLAKAIALALIESPKCNAAFDTDNAALIVRRYANIGIAVDAPQGLVVAVVRNCETKSVEEIGAQATALADKARDKGLTLSEMSGASFTISSLGALGGTSFTPIVNSPEAAILGISRMTEVPTRGPDDGIVWRRMLPVSLSYDHRILSGADAGRFLKLFEEKLATVIAATE